MAVLFSIQSGNLTDATTWGVVDNTSYLNSQAASQNIITTQTNSSTAFTPGAITISGVAIQMLGRITSPTGTVTMRLWNNTAGTTVKDVVINASDLPNTGGTTTPYIGWVYFKFDTPQTLLAATAYTIRMFSSVSSEVAVYRTATSFDWNRALITTTTSSPANTDTLLVGGEHTAAGVNSTYTITMNSTSNTNGYGLSLGAKCSFEYGTLASTNYKFRLSQSNLLIGRGATFKIGDSVTPVPSSSTAEFEFTCASAGQFRIDNYGTFVTHGATVTHRALLAADIAAGATTSTTDISTGWKNGDLIVFPSTTRTYSEYEVETLTADASGATLTHTSTTNAHGGDSVSMVQADLANLTRNIKFFSTSTTNRGYIQFLNAGSDATIFYTSFVDLGFSNSTTTAGIRVVNGLFNFQYNSYYQTSTASYIAFSTVFTSHTVSNNVFYNLGATALTGAPIRGFIADNNVMIGILGFGGIEGTIGSNNVISSCSNWSLIGNFFDGSSGISIYSNSGGWYYYAAITTSLSASNVKIWRNGRALILQAGTGNSNSRQHLITFDNLNCFGNGSNFSVAGANSGRILIKNSWVWGGSTLVQSYGVGGTSAVTTSEQFIFQNTVFGRRPDNVDSFFATACIASGIQSLYTFYNCSFYGTVASYFTYSFTPFYQPNGYMSFNHNNVAGDHRQFQIRGLLQIDTTYSTTGKSIRLTPQVTQQKTYSSTYRVAVKAGNTCTVTMQVRKSAAPDTVYNGAEPRLMLMMNLLGGITDETVCASYPNSNNLITLPESMSDVFWTKLRSAVSGTINSPIGIDNADKVIINNAATLSFIGANSTGLCSNSYLDTAISSVNFSVYLKYGGLNIARVLIGSTTNLNNQKYVDVNLETGTQVGSSGVSNIVVEGIGDGWFRVSIDVTPATASNNRFAVTLGDTVKTAGNGTDGVYVWGAQVTSGSGALPYIPLGAWETLTYTSPAVSADCVLEFYVDCHGTAGFINVDDFKTTTFVDTRNGTYLTPIGSYIEADWRRPGGSYGFIS